MKYLHYILIIIASMAKAMMDTLQDHFSISIFKNLNAGFWNKTVSWMGHKFLGIVVLDAWHLVQYAFLSLLFIDITLNSKLKPKWYDFFIFWGIYFTVFELFYDFIFRL